MLDRIGDAITAALEACLVLVQKAVSGEVLPAPESRVILRKMPTVHVTPARIPRESTPAIDAPTREIVAPDGAARDAEEDIIRHCHVDPAARRNGLVTHQARIRHYHFQPVQ